MLQSVDDLKVCPRNPRKISGEALAGLKVSLAMFGDIAGIVWNKRSGELIAGHQRVRALKAIYGEGLKIEGETLVAPTGESWTIRVVDWDEQTALSALVAANNPHIAGEFDDGLDALLKELRENDQELFEGLRLDELLDLPSDIDLPPPSSLVERFGVPPFSVLDVRQGYWRDRKAAWMEKGIESGEGRDEHLLMADSSQAPPVYELRNKMRARDGRDPSWEEITAEAKKRGINLQSSTSVFDPVLCELVYRWFSPPGGYVLDPFAGGSVRGIVAALLGRKYFGFDLRPEQIEANVRQAEKICRRGAASVPALRVERVGRVDVVRDDEVPGGTKRRALERLLPTWPEQEFVYASPAYGFAQIALAFACRAAGKQATIFVAKRKVLHPSTRVAQEAGAKIVQVEHGYLNVVQARAREYCAETGARLLPFGLDCEEFLEALADVLRELPHAPLEVWCVAGSGVLARAMQRAWPAALIHAVAIGKEPNVGNAKLYRAPEEFEAAAVVPPPFESNANYDAKAWRFIEEHASEGALFWNVAGDPAAAAESEIPLWIVGDSRTAELPEEEIDLVFSCPPYADLERYSDDPRDLSAMEYEGFCDAYREILVRAAGRLKTDRFAAIVISNVRDKAGHYRDLVDLTNRAMAEAGLHLYNDAILVNQAASAPIRAGRSFESSRKLTRIHQSVLVYVKGDPRKATEAIGLVEFGESDTELVGA